MSLPEPCVGKDEADTMESRKFTVEEIVKMPLQTDAINRAVVLVAELLSQTRSQLDKVPDPTRRIALASFFAYRVASIFEAVRLLADRGQYDECMTLSRVLIESTTTYAYINKKPDERVDSYIRYQALRTRRYLELADSMKKLMPFNFEPIPVEQRRSIEEPCRDMRSQGDDERIWRQIKVEAMASESGLNWLYLFYRLASDFVHGNMIAFVSGDAGPRDPHPDLVNMALTAACSGALVCAMESLDAIGAGPEAVVGVLLNLVDAISTMVGVPVQELVQVFQGMGKP